VIEIPESARVADARSRAAERLRRQRDALRPLGVVVIVAVAASAIGGRPAPGLHGDGLGVTLALCGFSASCAVAIGARFTALAYELQVAVIVAMGATGVALAALQPHDATGLAGGAAVWMAVARLPSGPGIALGISIAIALDVAAALSGQSGAAVLGLTLLCALLGFVAYFVRQSRASQSRTEELLALLEDAREEQLHAAALTERSRIAGELHDVLAHSLSGAAIQLQGARVLADREQASERVRTAIDRAGELVKDGLANARQAVGALRGDALPSVEELGSLIDSFRDDMSVDVTLAIEGSARTLPADASLALYRGAQEALTNVARYAPGARATVLLHYDSGHTTLTVEDRLGAPPSRSGLQGVGGSRGLAGLGERLERVGGVLQAGPIENGWRVHLDVPA
jgi:signal transduction histidine kinase